MSGPEDNSISEPLQTESRSTRVTSDPAAVLDFQRPKGFLNTIFTEDFWDFTVAIEVSEQSMGLCDFPWRMSSALSNVDSKNSEKSLKLFVTRILSGSSPEVSFDTWCGNIAEFSVTDNFLPGRYRFQVNGPKFCLFMCKIENFLKSWKGYSVALNFFILCDPTHMVAIFDILSL